MILVFWQNVISPHQLPYIKELISIPCVEEVVLVVNEVVGKERKSMGWNALSEEVKQAGIILYISPSHVTVEKLLETSACETHNFFSGIRAFPFIFQVFRKSLKYKLKRYLIVEGPFRYNKPLILHLVKTFLLEKKYFNKVNKVFAIGMPAQNWYSFWGFKSHQIVPFTYCVEPPVFEERNSIEPPCFIFVGSLIRRKGIDYLINAFQNQKKDYRLDIVGDGPELSNLLTLVERYQMQNKIRFLKGKDIQEVYARYKDYDALILPSRYDGWGAVVNEALMAGLFVICSDRCGASELIESKSNGIVFALTESGSLDASISYVIDNIAGIRSARCSIRDWSKKISGKSIADYLIDSIRKNEENCSRHFLN